MIDGNKYIETVKMFFSFLEEEFEYTLHRKTQRGNVFYDVEYKNTDRIISISYENLEHHLEVIVFKLIKGKLPDYDDKTHTLHLTELNKRVLSMINRNEIEMNNLIFKKYGANGNFEKKILKSARELRLVLMNWDNA